MLFSLWWCWLSMENNFCHPNPYYAFRELSGSREKPKKMKTKIGLSKYKTFDSNLDYEMLNCSSRWSALHNKKIKTQHDNTYELEDKTKSLVLLG